VRLKPGTLPKGEASRTVPLLFPKTDWPVTDEEVRDYLAAMPYAFAYDRQSKDEELRRKDATGARRRVAAIMATAELAHLTLPQPETVIDQEDGDLPFLYDERFWYLDGQHKKATGYAANQDARPKLWEAFLKSQALARHKAGPSHFIVGEASRFFRDPRWATEFASALWYHQIRLVVHPFGDVTEYNISGLIAYINATSGWLPMIGKGAREARKAQKRPFSIRVPFCLRVSGPEGCEPEQTRTHIWTRAETWPAFSEAVKQLANGVLKNSYDAVAWLDQERGIHLSKSRFLQILYSRIPEGFHTLYDETCTPRRVVQEGGLWSDLDITETGNRRYLVQDVEGIDFPIRYTPGTTPIELAEVLAARRRVKGRKGRPATTDKAGEEAKSTRGKRRQEEVFLGTYKIRCAVCSSSVRQFAPYGKTGTKWLLLCNCVQNLRMGGTRTEKRLTLPQARAHIEATNPHVQAADVNLQELIWNALMDRMSKLAPPGENTAPDQTTRAMNAKAKAIEAETRFKEFQQRVAVGLMGDPKDDLIRESIEENRKQLHTAVLQARAEASRLTTDHLTAEKEAIARKEIAFLIRQAREEMKDPAERRAILDDLLEVVVVHLEEGWAEITARRDWSALRRLRVRWGVTEKESSSWSPLLFTDPWKVRWAA